ncbi:hypothetical protein GTA26_28510, partial [Rhodococcus hoagii]|nr:hypothetical protein [Prescottella equi]
AALPRAFFSRGYRSHRLHMLMSSFCFYRVSNRHTFSEIFQIDMTDGRSTRHKQMIGRRRARAISRHEGDRTCCTCPMTAKTPGRS